MSDYALTNLINISTVPIFDPSITEISAQNLWMQCYVVAQYLLEIDAGFSDANSILVDVLSLR